MVNKKFISLLICTCIFTLSSLLIAGPQDVRGKVLKFNGDVKIIDVNGDERAVKTIDEPLQEMDTIVTSEGARIVVHFDDGALSVLDEQSRLRVEKSNWYSYLGGKIYFTFKKVFGEPRRVKMRTATIGIRGTTFIISENEQKNGESVALKEGLLDIESTGPVFEIRRQKELDEFERFKLEQRAENVQRQDTFEQYREQTMREFVEYRHRFTMQPDRVINLSGYRVDESSMTKVNEADFESFESEAEDLIKNFRSRSKDLIAK